MQFVKISQSDLVELETEIARLKRNLAQLAEENKGLILMQDCHIGQISELKQSLQDKDEELKEAKMRAKHSDLLTSEFVEARDKIRETEGTLAAKANEITLLKRTHVQTTEGLQRQIRSLQEELESVTENQRHF